MKPNMRGWCTRKMEDTLMGMAPEIALATKPGERRGLVEGSNLEFK